MTSNSPLANSITFTQVALRQTGKFIIRTNITSSLKNFKVLKNRITSEMHQLPMKHSIEETKEPFLFEQIGLKSKKKL